MGTDLQGSVMLVRRDILPACLNVGGSWYHHIITITPKDIIPKQKQAFLMPALAGSLGPFILFGKRFLDVFNGKMRIHQNMSVHGAVNWCMYKTSDS